MFSTILVNALNFSAVAFNAQCDPTKDNPSTPFFGFPHWWKYIHKGTGDALGGCTPGVSFSNGPSGLLAIGLAVVDMLLYLGGIAAVVSIIIAGIQYIMATGDSAKITSARKRIQNSLIGLAIVFVATALVSFLGEALT